MTNLACRNSGAGRRVGRELATARGVYTDVFEQSLLLDRHANKPWNFLASLGIELMAVSLVILIPLAYADHLQVFHWKDVTVGPPPSTPKAERVATRNSGATNSTLATAPHRVFHIDPRASLESPQAMSFDIASDAPPSLGAEGMGGSTKMLGTFIPNIVAALPPKPVIAIPKQPSAPIAVGGDVQMAKLVRKVIPAYPQIARAARISGIVRLIGTIGKDGTIRNLQIVSGHPVLARAAMEAVQHWVYKPTLLNGSPVEVIAPIEVSFTLGQ